MSDLSDAVARTTRKVQAHGADLLMSASGRSSVSRAVGTGIGLESSITKVWGAYQQQTARMLGYADRREVRRLRELVRSLEFRVETLEDQLAARTDENQDPAT